MKRTVIAGLIFASVAISAAPAAWPATRAGALARDWVRAFNAGEEPMRVYLQRNASAESLLQRPMQQRLVTYRELRTRFGLLRLGSVRTQTASTLEVTLVASEDGGARTFTFDFQGREPYKLRSVRILDQQMHGH